MACIPFIPIMLSPWAIFPHSFPIALHQVLRYSGSSSASREYLLITSPIFGWTTGAQKCSMSHMADVDGGGVSTSGTNVGVLSDHTLDVIASTATCETMYTECMSVRFGFAIGVCSLSSSSLSSNKS